MSSRGAHSLAIKRDSTRSASLASTPLTPTVEASDGLDVSLLETPHPLPAEPDPFMKVVCIPGATHLCITFDHRCATHSSDVLRIQLPAPPLPDDWTLEGEIAAFTGTPAEGVEASAGGNVQALERQARREEFHGHFGNAYALFMSAYAASPDPSLMLSAARIKLRRLGDPFVAKALLEGMIAMLDAPAASSPRNISAAAAAQVLLSEAQKAAAAGTGRVLEYAGGPAHWPRRPLILPGCECTIVLAYVRRLEPLLSRRVLTLLSDWPA